MQRTIVGMGLVLSVFVSCVFPGPAPLSARGGFGGGGGGGRSFGGGGGGRSFGGGDFGARGFGGDYHGDAGMRSDSFRDFDRSFDNQSDRSFDRPFGSDSMRDDRPSAFSGPAHDSSRPMDNGVRNYGTQRSLASDGGFNNVFKNASGNLPRGNQTWRATPASLANQAGAVRHNFNNYGAFHGNWWGDHPNAWHRNWNDWWPWQWSSWGALAGWWGVGVADLPVYYDYGDNITYDDNGYVDYGSAPTCTASDYYQQSLDLSSAGLDDSAAGPAPANQGSAANAASDTVSDWKPLGVFSLVQSGQTSSSTLFQLCTNKKGQIRGNYYNALTDETQPVQGSIDKKRMRAAWTVGKSNRVVYDTGVSNLLKDQCPVLIHFDKDTTQQWTLVRVKNPGASNKA